MLVPFLDLKIQYRKLKNEIDAALKEVFENTAFIMGKAVFDFEKDFAAAHNVKHCLGTSSGTDGNHIVLWALGVGPGDEVIIPANTFIATAWGATLCGATPVFVDCHPESYNLDPAKVEAAITAKTKAIVAVHLYGQAADMDALRRIALKHNLYLVEDAAQAHLAEYKGNPVGGLSNAASFSFYPGKNLGAYGEAGAAVTNDDDVAAKMKLLREHGQSKKYYHDTFGHNYRMEGIQGAVLGVKLKYLHEWTDSRRSVARKYNELLSDLDYLTLPSEMDYGKHVYHLYVLKVGDSDSELRDELGNYLKEQDIHTGMHYPVPLHMQKCFTHLGYNQGDFPVTEKLASTGISLPMYPDLTDAQIEYVCDKVKCFFKTKLDKQVA